MRFAPAMKFSSPLPRDCAGFAPQLTALFDGEADETQAQQARAHLLVCPQCSTAWLNWTQYRATLQSEPVPAPPPTFLWRLLIAYRVAAFAQPARRRSNLPTISASTLRDLEAPLPPRLSQHILARTTRKPSAHVMLTPLTGAPPATSARHRARAAKFRRFPLVAAPALALWILMLGRTDLVATFPVHTSDATISLAPSNKMNSAPQNEKLNSIKFVPVPVLSAPFTANDTSPQFNEASGAVPLNERVETRSVARARGNVNSPVFAVAPRLSRTRNVGQSGETLNRALLLAMNTGRTDIVRAQTVTVIRPAAPVRVVAPLASVPVPQSARSVKTVAPERELRRRDIRAVSRPVFVSEPSSDFVSLAALTAPIGPVRTFTAARLRPAVFSEDSTRPRVTFASAAGSRLARVMPDDNEISLRVSRPVVGVPTLRPVNSSGDNGPRLEDLRSAVDDFRASVSGEHFGDG